MSEEKTQRLVVEAQTHGSVLLLKRLNSGRPAPLLTGFHGYGENAWHQLRRLQSIGESSHWSLCCIQSLHLFYREKDRRVVGSWMTSQDRLAAIEDNVRYVARVMAQVRGDPPVSALVYAGFSQGSAMAYRAAALAGQRADGLIILAGDVPPALAESPDLTLPPVLLGRGTDDPWYTDAKMDRDLKVLRKRAETVETVVFEGGHAWSPAFAAACSRFLKQIRTDPRTDF